MAENLIPEINIGMVGHVDHGKTTLTSALTGKFTDEHSEELKRGITIRLGYADAAIRKCPKCKGDLAYTRFRKCFHCGSEAKLLRTISFVDLPGHETLIATVLTGASILDGALLVIAANETCPQPQTEEHLQALNIAGIKNIVIAQTKIDLVSTEEAEKNNEQIKKLVKGTVAENAPVIPVSAQHAVNLGFLLQAIQDTIPTPKRDGKKSPRLLTARTFDINKPGTPIKDLTGGVIGGSLVQGTLSVGDEIEMLPGIQIKNNWQVLTTKIASIHQGGNQVKTGKPGGLLAVSTELDPCLTKSDSLAGSVVGKQGHLPKIWHELKLEMNLLKRVVGGKDELKIDNIKQNDIILMNAGTQKNIGVCIQPGKNPVFKLKRPLCADAGEKVALSKQISNRWRLIGWGIIKK